MNMLENQKIETLSLQLGQLAKRHGIVVTSAESCTGGGVSYAITHTPGASSWFHAAFIVYSNKMKEQLLGVSQELIQNKGAVSEEVTSALVKGALQKTEADLAVAVSGVAGPTGGTSTKPVGMVCFSWGWAEDTTVISSTKVFNGDRTAIRNQAIVYGLQGLIDRIIEKNKKNTV